jgi:hypothetical protein
MNVTKRSVASTSRRRFVRDAVAIVAGATAATATRAKEAIAAMADFPEGLTVTVGGRLARRFSLSPRTASLLTFPVPTLRPTQPDTAIALDVMPNGSPAEIEGHGRAWIDVCDRDVLLSETDPVATARVGVFERHAEFGTRSFHGAAQKELHITTDAPGDVPGPAIRVVPWGDRTGGVVLGADGSRVALGSGLPLARSATRGFPMMQRVSGSPTARPESFGHTNPFAYDQTTKKVWVYDYDDARWRSIDTV